MNAREKSSTTATSAARVADDARFTASQNTATDVASDSAKVA
jgi:hypothetical protein